MPPFLQQTSIHGQMCGLFMQVLMVTLQSVLELDWQLCFSPERVKCSWMFLVPSAMVGGPLIGTQQYPVKRSHLGLAAEIGQPLPDGGLEPYQVRRVFESILSSFCLLLVWYFLSLLGRNRILNEFLVSLTAAKWCGHKLTRLGKRWVTAVANYSCSEARHRLWTALCSLLEPGQYLGPYALVIGRGSFKFSFTYFPCI